MKNKETLATSFSLKAIDILQLNMISPVDGEKLPIDYRFVLQIDSKADFKSNILALIVKAEIWDTNQKKQFATIEAGFSYEISSFADAVRIAENGKTVVNEQLNVTLNSISISTLRGIMFSTFKGTYLHGVLLPIIDPTKFRESE